MHREHAEPRHKTLEYLTERHNVAFGRPWFDPEFQFGLAGSEVDFAAIRFDRINNDICRSNRMQVSGTTPASAA
jgi:hypothetical protein